MFAAAREAVKKVILSPEFAGKDVLSLSPQCLPEKYSFGQIRQELDMGLNNEIGREDELERLLVLSSCLRSPTKLVRVREDLTWVMEISVWISAAILPGGNLVPNDETAEDNSSATRKQALLQTRRKGILGLQSLTFLLNLDPPDTLIHDQILVSAVAFNSPHDPWSTPLTIELSTKILSDHTYMKELFIVYFLENVIRPLFSKSRPSTVTETGRKAMPSSKPELRYDLLAERGQKPWKYEAPYAITILEVAVDNANESIIKGYWNLFVPPILTLLDESDTSIRRRGLEILYSFLKHFPSTLLIQRGFHSVFEDAVTPTLLFLPSLTPVEESLELLPAAYTVLYKLCDLCYPSPLSTLPQSSDSISESKLNDKDKEKLDEENKERLKFLDRIMRNGVMKAYSYVYPRQEIVEVLVKEIGTLVHKMGIHAVKHLYDIMPMVCQALKDPFGSARPSLLLTSVKTLQTIILNTWPRISEKNYFIEVINALLSCLRWMNTDEKALDNKERQILEEVRKEICIAGRLLVKAVDGQLHVREILEEARALNEELVNDVFGVHEDSPLVTGDVSFD